MRKDIRNGIADKNKKGLANDKGNWRQRKAKERENIDCSKDREAEIAGEEGII